jgi:hypothetical protein
VPDTPKSPNIDSSPHNSAPTDEPEAVPDAVPDVTELEEPEAPPADEESSGSEELEIVNEDIISECDLAYSSDSDPFLVSESEDETLRFKENLKSDGEISESDDEVGADRRICEVHEVPKSPGASAVPQSPEVCPCPCPDSSLLSTPDQCVHPEPYDPSAAGLDDDPFEAGLEDGSVMPTMIGSVYHSYLFCVLDETVYVL